MFYYVGPSNGVPSLVRLVNVNNASVCIDARDEVHVMYAVNTSMAIKDRCRVIVSIVITYPKIKVLAGA